MGPKYPMTCVIRERQKTEKRRSYVKTDRGWNGVTTSQGPPGRAGAGSSKEGSSPRGFGGGLALPTP